MYYEISDHARNEMESSNITEEDVKACLEHGSLEVKQFIKGELRYGKKIQLKDKIIIVIYSKVKSGLKIITVYPIRRKKW